MVRLLDDIFPESKHVSDVMSERSDDEQIWNYAKEFGYAIVTKDDDFEQKSVLFGHPPKLIWLRLGNCKTSDIESLLRRSSNTLIAFDADDQKSFLPLP